MKVKIRILSANGFLVSLYLDFCISRLTFKIPYSAMHYLMYAFSNELHHIFFCVDSVPSDMLHCVLRTRLSRNRRLNIRITEYVLRDHDPLCRSTELGIVFEWLTKYLLYACDFPTLPVG